MLPESFYESWGWNGAGGSEQSVMAVCVRHRWCHLGILVLAVHLLKTGDDYKNLISTGTSESLP